MSETHPPQHETRCRIKCSFCFYTAEVVCMVHEFCCAHSKLEHILAAIWCVCWYSCRTSTLQSGLPEHAVWWVWRWSIWHRWLLGNKSRLNKNLVYAPQYCYLYNGSIDQVFLRFDHGKDGWTSVIWGQDSIRIGIIPHDKIGKEFGRNQIIEVWL